MTGQPESRPQNITTLLADLAGEEYCYVTTTGRVSGHPHKIEIWFGIQNNSLYLLSGGGDRSDWVKNMRTNPLVSVRIAAHTFAGSSRFVQDKQEDGVARRLLAAKYQDWRPGQSFSDWALTALPVAIDLQRV